MSASLRSLSTVGDRAIADLGRRVLDPDGETGATSNSLRQRAATLERQLDQVDGSLSMLAQRLPELDSGANRLAERLEATTTGFERVEAQVATIEAQAPELALWLEGSARRWRRTSRVAGEPRRAWRRDNDAARRARGLARPAGRCHPLARGGSGAGQAAGRRSRASSRSGACRRAAGERAGQSGRRGVRRSKARLRRRPTLSFAAGRADGRGG